jgi:ATP-dependent helicase IRC3
MELKDIKEITNEIVNTLRESSKGLSYRKYDTFLEWFDMGYKRKREVLNKVDYQLKKHHITLWCGNEERFSVWDYSRGEIITFRFSEINNIKSSDNPPIAKKTVNYKNAGTIEIANGESGIQLYKHQEDAIESLNQKIIKTNKVPFGGLLVLPTGGGKTLTAAYWLCKNLLDKNKKVLWIAHRHELLEQAKATFHHKLAFNDIFTSKKSFNYRIISGIHDKPVNIRQNDDIIISSKDSVNAGFEYLYHNWIKNNNEEIFLVIDEAHHATAKTYRKLISQLQEKTGNFRMIGLTATPFRTAEVEKGLLAKVFPDDIIYKIDLKTLIARGILSEPIFEEVQTEFDMTKYLSEEELNNLTYFDIDSIGKGTAKTIAENDQRNWCIINKYVKNKGKYKQTIVFALNQDNAIALKQLFLTEGVKADFVLSSIKDIATGVVISSKENKDKIDKFRNGDLEVLINVNILTEGTDVPNVQSIFLARPTISPILMTQMMGRGLRGEKAGGTKEAYIVSFIDDWKDKVKWVNPEKLIIEENTDFNDTSKDTQQKIVRIVAINKIEEFAILTNKIMDAAAKEALERLDFIERIPVGLYHFSLLSYHETTNKLKPEKNCEVLVYNNIQSAYQDFINALPEFFKTQKIASKEFLTEIELKALCEKIENKFFSDCEKYPGYSEVDIMDILQYYAQNGIAPQFIELKDRTKYDLSIEAAQIYDGNLGRREEEEFKTNLWDSNQVEWKAFFGYDKKYFLNEIDLAIRKLANPKLYIRQNVLPKDIKEIRSFERMKMDEIRDANPEFWKQLSDDVYSRYKDEEGYYFSAQSGYKSKNKLDFQIDHKKSIKSGGLTTIDNLQLLTREENGKKGAD